MKEAYHGTIVFYLTLLFRVCMVWGQDSVDFKKPKDIAIENLSFFELGEQEREAYLNDKLDLLRVLSDVHVIRAKKDNNDVEIARGYMYRTVIEEDELALKYADSMIWATKGSDHPEFPTKGHFLKAGIHYVEGRYREALASYAMAYSLALEKGNHKDQMESTMNIAAIRNINGQPGIAANLYHRALFLLMKNPDFKSEGYDDHMILLHNLALAHLRLNQLDSTVHYTQLGREHALSQGDGETVRDFVLIRAQADYYAGAYQSAKDTLLKYVDELEPKPKAVKWYYLGKIAQHEGRQDLANSYFTSIDSILEITKEPFPELQEVYLQLMADAAEKGDRDEQLAYIDKLIRYDSILALEKQGVSDQAVVAYDIPYLKAQRKEVSETLESRQQWLYGILALFILSLIAGTYFYVRNKKMTQKVRELTAAPNITWTPEEEVQGEAPGVPEEIRERILQELERFEESDRWNKSDLNLQKLADQMGTNTTYLSAIINHYKKMSFPTYLKELRIAKAIPRLTHDTALLKFNYGGLAHEFGFRTADSFAKALYKRTGAYPSKFLKELEQRKKDDDL